MKRLTYQNDHAYVYCGLLWCVTMDYSGLLWTTMDDLKIPCKMIFEATPSCAESGAEAYWSNTEFTFVFSV